MSTNPFADIQAFESMRAAAFRGPSEFDEYLRSRAAAERRLNRPLPVRLSPRIQRMVRIAIASSRAVLLVGPPGTGKTEVLQQVIDDINDDPARYGFGGERIVPSWNTPEEEWTFDSLVLGDTLVDGEIRSVEGPLLQAIRKGEWLVLDEANRADMDKILGGALTWLSGQRVGIGTWREAGKADRAVFLSWGQQPGSTVFDDPLTKNREFEAGMHWRLLGTYNPVDAQRVFRMGQALSRRFKHIPIPPASREDFSELIAQYAEGEGAPEALARKVTDMYASHLGIDGTALGPGLFVDIPAYVARGIWISQLDSGSETDGGEGEVDSASEGDAAAKLAELTEQLLAEAYVACVGSIVSKFEPDILAELGARFVGAQALTAASWTWITDNLATMRA